MLTGKFHSHLTLADGSQAEVARRVVGGKVTVIDLWRDDDRRQDTMLTHHFVSGHRGLVCDQGKLNLLFGHVNKLRMHGIEVVRTKLEFEYLASRSPVGQTEEINRTACYVEVHAETRRPLIAPLTGARSENPCTTTEFWTMRFYRAQTDDMVGDAASYTQSLDSSTLVELKVEAVAYDDNPAHDAWWVTHNA